MVRAFALWGHSEYIYKKKRRRDTSGTFFMIWSVFSCYEVCCWARFFVSPIPPGSLSCICDEPRHHRQWILILSMSGEGNSFEGKELPLPAHKPKFAVIFLPSATSTWRRYLCWHRVVSISRNELTCPFLRKYIALDYLRTLQVRTLQTNWCWPTLYKSC